MGNGTRQLQHVVTTYVSNHVIASAPFMGQHRARGFTCWRGRETS